MSMIAETITIAPPSPMNGQAVSNQLNYIVATPFVLDKIKSIVASFVVTNI